MADVCEWYDDASRHFRIEVRVVNRVWGPLFGYRGWFDAHGSRWGRTAFPPTSGPLARSAVNSAQ